MLCISAYMIYSGELFHRGFSGGINRVDHPIFFWVSVTLWTLLAVILIIYHFIGKEKLINLSNKINNKKL